MDVMAENTSGKFGTNVPFPFGDHQEESGERRGRSDQRIREVLCKGQTATPGPEPSNC